MKRISILMGVAALLTAVPAAGQTTLQVGPYLAYHDDFDLGVGGFVGVPLASIDENLSFVGDFGVFFPDKRGRADVNYWEANADALYQFPLEEYSFTPWVLGGLNIAHWSVGRDEVLEEPSASDTEIGINLGGGVTFATEGPIRPFVGVKVELSGGEGGILFGGLTFTVGGGGQ